MSLRWVEAGKVAPQAWRNGGGQTRELLAWPEGPHWQVRISRADIGADGPFSEFAGVQRWFVVLEGAGVVLQFADGATTLRAGDAPLAFDGASAPDCRLIDGSTQDLNLMVRGGRGTLQAAQTGLAWAGDYAMRGLYAATSGVWSNGVQTLALPAHALLWSAAADPRPWTFQSHHFDHAHESQPAARAWWLGFTPDATP